MRSINVHEAKTHLSRLVEEAAAGEPFIIAKAGRPVAMVVPLDAPPPTEQRRTGFLVGAIKVPDDFDRMDAGSIAQEFEGAEPAPSPDAIGGPCFGVAFD